VAATHAPLLSSASTTWSGFLLEKHDAGDRQDVCVGWHRTHVCLFTKGSLQFRINKPAGSEEVVARAGNVCIFPRGFPETRFSIAGSKFEAIVVELDPARVEALAGRKAAIGSLTPQIVVEDTVIAALLTNMAAEVAEGCPGGTLYGESVSLSLSSYLLGRFALKRATQQALRKFSQVEARRVTDYIHANLDRALNLTELAELVQLRPRSFFRIFSSTFGTTPHRYIIEQRVDVAKQLIARGHRLAEMAVKLGFASQSHFASVFRKVAGMPPGQFRYRCSRSLHSPAVSN
jgi:AraC family transcriptional regulator